MAMPRKMARRDVGQDVALVLLVVATGWDLELVAELVLAVWGVVGEGVLFALDVEVEKAIFVFLTRIFWINASLGLGENRGWFLTRVSWR